MEVTLHPGELLCDASSLGTEGWVARPFIPKVTHVAAAMIEPPVFGSMDTVTVPEGHTHETAAPAQGGIWGLSRLPAPF